MPISEPITQAVTDALIDAPLLPRDVVGVELIKRYAALLDADADNPELVNDIGPKLLAALTALGMTPAARSVKGGGEGAANVAGKLDELRARRNKRAG